MNAMYGKADYEHMVRKRVSAFTQIARALGNSHPITKMLGPLAWGRHGAEWGPGQGDLRKVVEAYGHLNGYFACLNLWARDNDRVAQMIMLKHWPHGMEKSS